MFYQIAITEIKTNFKKIKMKNDYMPHTGSVEYKPMPYCAILMASDISITPILITSALFF